MNIFRKIFAAALCAGLTATVSGHEPGQGGLPGPDLLFVSKTVQWKKAYNSGDAGNLHPLYAEDAQYISSHVPGLVAEGRERVVAYFQGGIDMGGHIDSIEIVRTEMSCDLVTLLCRYQATNSGVTFAGRNLLILRKINGEWLIVQHMTVV